MIKKTLDKVNIEIYEETLSNGLNIYIVPFREKNTVYVTLSTKYGSTINEFIPIGKKDYVKVPDGVAHFLEHKVFEQKDGVDPFSFFSERGADCNANTSNYKTTYLFSGTGFFEENLKYLLSYVTDPYFTDENVLKEKGIIEQELKMYDDDPYSKLYETVLKNSFIKHPIRIPVGGTVESIKEITKEDLYTCYNTFYHPSNMFLVVVGNVDVKNTIKIVNDFYKTKKYDKMAEIKTKTYKEPDKVFKEYDEIKMNVNIPKVSVNYKINFTKSKLPYIKKMMYLSAFLDIKFGPTSLLVERLKKEGITNYDLAYELVKTDTHALIMFEDDTKEKDKLIKYIDEEINDKSITEEELQRKKKVFISNNIYSSDNIYSINNKIMGNIIRYGEIQVNVLDILNSLNIEEYNEFIKTINFDNRNITIINPK